AGEAAALCLAHAEQQHEIGAVGVVAQMLVAAIAARRRGAEPDAEIAHLAEQLAVLALRHRDAEMGADAPDDEARLFLGIVPGRQAAQEDEASPFLELARDARKAAGKSGEREVAAPDL